MGDVSAEVIATDFDGIIEEGKELAAIAPNIVVKVPMIKDGIKALSWFRDHNIARTVRWSSLLVRRSWQLKQGLLTYLLS
jgi:transaldolase